MSLPLQLGSRDNFWTRAPKVKTLQQNLNWILKASLKADGKFGASTEAAVKQFQTSQGLVADGIVGPVTWAAIRNPQPVLPPPVTAPPVVIVTPPPVVTPPVVPPPVVTPPVTPPVVTPPVVVTPPTTSTGRIGTRVFGAYVDNSAGSATLWDMPPLADMETKLGHKLDLVSGFCQGGDLPDLVTNMKAVAPRKVMLSYDVQYSAADIIAGKYDKQFTADANAIKSVGANVYLRLWAEMNLDEATWAVASSQSKVKSTAEWISAWKHIVTLMRGITPLVKFIWCPNITDAGAYKLESYYPGSDLVDLLGFDGYNWGSPWQSHTQVFQPIYDRLIKLDAKLPIWVGETGCAEGTNKGAWISTLLNDTGFPRIEAVAWFSVNKEKNWAMDSSAAAVQAFKDGLD